MDEVLVARFTGLLRAASFAAGGCVVAYSALGIGFGDHTLLNSAGIIALYISILVLAQHMVRTERMATATQITSLGLAVAAIGLTVAQPALWINYAVVPMLAAALLLQYAPEVQMVAALSVCGSAIAVIAVLGETLPVTATLPPLLISGLRIGSLITTTAFVLLLLWQFRTRLILALASLQTAHTTLQERHADLQATNEQLAAQIQQSQFLVTQVTALEAPVTQLAPNVLYAPLVGIMSMSRAIHIQTTLLSVVYQARSRWIVLDVQGIAHIDADVAEMLLRLMQALKLLGCRVCLCGIVAGVAQVLIHYEKTIADDVIIARTPYDALQRIEHEFTPQLHSVPALSGSEQ